MVFNEASRSFRNFFNDFVLTFGYCLYWNWTDCLYWTFSPTIQFLIFSHAALVFSPWFWAGHILGIIMGNNHLNSLTYSGECKSRVTSLFQDPNNCAPRRLQTSRFTQPYFSLCDVGTLNRLKQNTLTAAVTYKQWESPQGRRGEGREGQGRALGLGPRSLPFFPLTSWFLYSSGFSQHCHPVGLPKQCCTGNL